MGHFAILSFLLILPAFTSAAAQEVARVASRADVRALLDSIRINNAWTLEQQTAICEIPAPPFKEAARALDYRRRFEALGLTNVRIDSVGNVIGERRGTGGGPTIVVAGHLDTVFPEGTDVTVRKVGERYVGRGIGDNCRGLAVILAVARAVQSSSVMTSGTIIFVGDVGEEGPGNLRGMRHLFGSELKGRIDYFISVDGAGNDIVGRAVGSHRYRVTYKGRGGHSYGDFGIPNPAHALGRAMAGIADIQVPKSPKATFSVGVISGGTSVNSIPFEASMELDLRSESSAALAVLDSKAQRIIRGAAVAENRRWGGSANRLTVVIDTIGIRPAGSQPDSARIIRIAKEGALLLGWKPKVNASSTDANIPISMGIPGISTDGGGTGGGAHGLDEWYEDGAEGWKGPQWALLQLLTLAGVNENPQQAFWASLQTLCGRAFEGRVVEGSPGDSVFRRERLVMHVRSCTPDEIRIPFHAGSDRSRTWVLTRPGQAVRLKHDHRHADGKPDSVTQYGGDTRGAGTPARQEFYADSLTANLIPSARTNVWTMEVVPGKKFFYALRREGTDRRFRVEFDLTKPVAAPPPPW